MATEWGEALDALAAQLDEVERRLDAEWGVDELELTPLPVGVPWTAAEQERALQLLENLQQVSIRIRQAMAVLAGELGDLTRRRSAASAYGQ